MNNVCRICILTLSIGFNSNKQILATIILQKLSSRKVSPANTVSSKDRGALKIFPVG